MSYISTGLIPICGPGATQIGGSGELGYCGPDIILLQQRHEWLHTLMLVSVRRPLRASLRDNYPVDAELLQSLLRTQ